MPPVNQNTRQLGSTSIGYTPRGEKHLTPYDATGEISVTVERIGTNERKWDILFVPEKMQSKIEKYAQLGCLLSGQHVPPYCIIPLARQLQMAAIADQLPVVSIEPVVIEVPTAATADKQSMARKVGRPIVDYNTGRYYASITLATRITGLSQQMIRYSMEHDVTAKGRTLRYATPDQITAASMNPAWSLHKDLLLPVTKGKRLKH